MSLRKDVATGVRWTGISAAVVLVTVTISRIILANLLSPEDFGLFGMILPVVVFLQTFADMGISFAIIYRQDVTSQQLSSLYWSNLLLGLLGFIIMLTVAPLVAGFYSEPRLNTLLVWMAFVFLITPFGQQYQMLLQKALRFKRLAIIEITSSLAGSVVGIGAALADKGTLSLVLGLLVTAFIKACMLVIWGWAEWRPLLHFRYYDVKSFLGFGLFQIGERTLNYFSANIDYIIIGRVLGAEILGIYTIAYQLVVLPFRRLNPILTKVAFPVFSKRQNDDEALRRGYGEMLKLIGFIIFPIVIGIAVTAQLSVPVMMGSKWDDAIPLIQILAVLGMVKALGNPSGSLLLAKGRADLGFYINVFALVVNTAAFLWAVNYGIQFLAFVEVIASLFVTFMLYQIIQHVIGFSHRNVIVAINQPAIFSMLMGSLVLLVYQSLQSSGLTNIQLLIILVICGIGLYTVMVILWMRDYIVELLKLMMPHMFTPKDT